MPGLISIILVLILSTGCAGGRQLPPLKAADSIVVEIRPMENPTQKIHTAILQKDQITSIVAFVNAQPAKWTVPWYGPPVGTIYFKFFDNGKYAGNFYIGPVFFGRDAGNFWSQRTTRAKIEELERISGMSLWRYLTIH